MNSAVYNLKEDIYIFIDIHVSGWSDNPNKTCMIHVVLFIIVMWGRQVYTGNPFFHSAKKKKKC